VEVQIFRAALRFFAERRIKTHFDVAGLGRRGPGGRVSSCERIPPETPVTTKYESAKLLLKLYDLRREPVMRKARAWFREDFHPKSAEEILAVYRGKTSAAYRMVTTYWNMAAALVLHEAIDEKMFADVNGEHLMVYARLQPFLTEFRGLLNNPTYLDKLEQVILRMPDAQARLARFRRPAPPAKTTSKGPRRVA